MMSFVFQAWNRRKQDDLRLKQLSKHAAALHRSYCERGWFYLWLSQSHTAKIENQMLTLHNMDVLRKVVKAWRDIKSKNNDKRLRTHRIRARLNEKPELARPLRILKNQLAFRAFNKLFEGARLIREEDRKTEAAHCQYYKNITKKVYLSLKLNAQLKFQDDKVEEIAELFMKRRWLGYMKEGTVYLKQRRTMRQKASIFRFLALQKKALQVMVSHTVTR
jgi:hypothetical protein